MPLRDWAKKHLQKKDPEKESPAPEIAEPVQEQEFKVFRSDSIGVTPLIIPTEGNESGGLKSPVIRSPSPIPASASATKKSLLPKLGYHRNTSQNSLEDWQEPDASNPNAERDWEARATKLAKLRPSSLTSSQEDLANLATLSIKDDSRPSTSADGRLLPEQSNAPAIVDGLNSDDALQEAIRLHETGELEKATAMFKKIAEQPINDESRVLAQLLYGLSLRHGWGCEANMSKAVIYLKAAAENAANEEDDALASGLTKGGKLKDELTLAIYELGNCFRNGWGVEKDNKAARQYFETAAHLGDPEAANEAAWHWMNGVGCKRSKKQAAKYYRLGEQNGGKKLVGNSWIWKDKYD